jgi:hypothetical protein
MEQINAFLGKLSECSYRRIFIVYHHHGAAIEPFLHVETEKGTIDEVRYIGDQRKEKEKALDELHWYKSHRDIKFGFDRNDLSKWTVKGSENVREGLLPVRKDTYTPQVRCLKRIFG